MSVERACVYTVLTSGYEVLNEQPVAAGSTLPFICFTDDPTLASATWRMRPVQPIFGFDGHRSQRDLKIRCHLQLPEFDASLYIDNSVLLREPPERLFEAFDAASGMAVPLHSFHDTVLDEFLAVAEGRYDDQGRIFEQLNHYLVDCPGILDEKPYWTAILLRDHRNPRVRAALEIWAAHVLRYSLRDQLSANLAFRQAGLTPQPLAIDNRSSPYHSWPHAVGRRPRETRHAASLLPLAARYRRLEAASATERDRLKALDHELAGKAKRVAALERALAESNRRLKELRTSGVVVARTAAGNWIFANPRDNRARQLINSRGDLNPTALRMWRALIAERNWDLVVDVGANYGEMLVNGGQAPGAQVVAVEPNPKVRKYLKRTLAAAGLNAKVIGAALSDKNGRATLLVDRDWSGKSRLSPGGVMPDRAGQVSVRTITLGSLVRRRLRDTRGKVLAKIDVEGDEVAVLRGAEGMLGSLGAFVALIELAHLDREARTWLLERFDLDVFAPRKGRFVRVVPATVERLTEMLATKTFHPHDAVVRARRRAPAPGRGSS